MTAVRAFVGHSFLNEDKDVVRSFTDYLDTLKNSLNDFDWVHATEPRPDGVPNKVLELIENKNLFIGICTKNERVSKNEHFNRTWFGKNFKIEERDLNWKTSDWIIQEIGLAIGKRMKLILLLENGVRKPGGLFGDLEYISFARENLADAFQKLTGMIANISDSASGSSTLVAGKSAKNNNADDEVEADIEATDFEEPDVDWTTHKYSIEHLVALATDDKERAARIDNAYLSTVGGASTPAGAEWKSKVLFDMIRWGKGGSIGEVKALVAAYPRNATVLSFYAKVLKHYNDLPSAKRNFKAAAECEADPKAKISYLCEAAAINNGDSTFEELAEVRNLIDDTEIEQFALAELRSIEGLYGAKHYQLALLERQVQLDPTNTSLRFDLAFLHSNEGNKAAALHHYLQIPTNDRDSSTWNNLGVSFRDFSMPAKSTHAYQKAVSEGETLAMSNLAYIYMEAGFLQESQELITSALAIKGHHKNVAPTQVALDGIIESEDNKLESTLADVPRLSAFYADTGHEVWKPDLVSVAGKWKCSDFELIAKIDGLNFEAKGIEFEEGSKVTNALKGEGEKANQTAYDLTYTGTIRGRTIIGTRSRKKIDMGGGLAQQLSILGAFGSITPFIIVISADGLSARSNEGTEERLFSMTE